MASMAALTCVPCVCPDADSGICIAIRLERRLCSIIQCFAGPGTALSRKAMRCAAYLRGVVAKCIAAGLVGGEEFSIDASLISATSHDLGIGQVERSEAPPVDRGLECKLSSAPITAAVALRFANAVSEKRDGRLACQRYA
jgi:hypothetical protein